MNLFKDKVVWITGASSGYGEAMAKAFAQEGANVILSARWIQKLETIAEKIPNTKALELDLSQPETFKSKTKEAINLFGCIDIIIHNGAIAQNAFALETKKEVARYIMEVDYFSYTELTQALLPHFIERKTGHIVIVSGLLAKVTLPGRSSYAAAKAALFGYFGCLRTEVVRHNINVTILVPGAMKTDFVTKALKADGSHSNTSSPDSSDLIDVNIAAKQSLQAIKNKTYEIYIGNQDESFKLYQLLQSNPNQGIKLMLSKIKTS